MAEASPLKELKDSDTAAAAEKLMQISRKEHENNNRNSNNDNEKKMIERENVAGTDKKTMVLERDQKVPDFENDNKKTTTRRESALDIKKKITTTMKREKAQESSNNNNETTTTMKKRVKVQGSEIDRNRGDPETLATEVRKGVKSFGPKKQKYRSLRDIYKATEPVSNIVDVVDGNKKIKSEKNPNWFFQ